MIEALLCAICISLLYLYWPRRPKFIKGDYIVYDEQYFGFVIEQDAEFVTFHPNNSTILWTVEANRARKAR